MRRNRKKITLLDILVSIAVLVTGLYLYYRMKIGIHYRWDWAVIPQYICRFDEDTGRWVPNLILQGLFTTIKLSLWGTILATILGTIMGLCRTSSGLFNRLLGWTYVELTRNIPPLVLIFIFYFFISSQIIPLVGVEELIASCPDEAKYVLGVLFAPSQHVFGVLISYCDPGPFEGAYITEIVRAGIQSIEKGQWEASYALGFPGGSRFDMLFFRRLFSGFCLPWQASYIYYQRFSHSIRDIDPGIDVSGDGTYGSHLPHI